MYSVSAPFKLKGKRKMPVSEFIFTLSLDLKWFSPDQARIVLEKAVKRGLLRQTNDTLEPVFDIESVSVPSDYTPDFRKIVEASPFDILIDRIMAKTGKERREIVAEINRKYEEYGGMLEVSVIALVMAKELGVEISDIIGDICNYVFE